MEKLKEAIKLLEETLESDLVQIFLKNEDNLDKEREELLRKKELRDKNKNQDDIYIPGYLEIKPGDTWHTVVDICDKDGLYAFNSLIGICFKTKREVELHLKYLKAYKKYITTIARLNAEIEWKVNWKTDAKNKGVFAYNYHKNELKAFMTSLIQDRPDREHFAYSLRDKIREELGEDLIILAVTGKEL